MKMKQLPNWKPLAITGALAVALLGGQVLSYSGNAVAISTPSDSMSGSWQQGPPSFASLVEQVKPAVVSITITGKTNSMGNLPKQLPQLPENSPFNDLFRHFFQGQPGLSGQDRERGSEFQAVGSGFIISADGFVVTNNHVIDQAESIEVVLQNGNRLTATVTGRDSKTDLALLKVKGDKPLPYVELGNSDQAKVGEWVVAVGNPFGLGGTVTAGIISARGRDIHSGPFDDYLQIDAPINRGNSGGPLFNNYGRVIGINTAIFSPSGGNVGIGFAIPSSMATDIIAQLKSSGKVARGWLGVQIQAVTDAVAHSLDLKNKNGALVAYVEPNSPAERGGIIPGDVIVGMNGEQLHGFKDLSKLVAKAKSGSESNFEIERKGKTHRLEIKIGKMPTDDVKVALQGSGVKEDKAKLGIYLANLSVETRQRYGISKATEGVLVAGVEQGSPAARAGIRTGSVIDMVGQESVSTPDQIISKVKQAVQQKQASVLLRVEYKNQSQFVAVDFAAT